MGHATYRAPTVDEVAKALRYIEAEFVLTPGDDGCIHLDEYHWYEGLAYGPGRDFAPEAHHFAAAREVLPQLTEFQWRCLAADADRERTSQDMPTLYATNAIRETAT